MSRPYFTPGKDPVPIAQEAGGPQGRYGQVRKISPPPGFDPRSVQPVATVAIPTELPGPLTCNGEVITSPATAWMLHPAANLTKTYENLVNHFCAAKSLFRCRWF